MLVCSHLPPNLSIIICAGTEAKDIFTEIFFKFFSGDFSTRANRAREGRGEPVSILFLPGSVKCTGTLRKVGEMLLRTERQRPGEYKRLHHVTVWPTLSALGITKRENAEAQRLAELPGGMPAR